MKRRLMPWMFVLPAWLLAAGCAPDEQAALGEPASTPIESHGFLRAGDLSNAVELESSRIAPGADTVRAAAWMPGDFDPTFAGGGMVFYNINGYASASSDRTLTLPDGKIIVAGMLRTPEDRCEAYVSRFNANGSVDWTFAGGAGLSSVYLLTSSNCGFAAAALQSDGKIVVATTKATSAWPNESDFVLARFNANGFLDTTFGQGGIVTFDYGDMDSLKDVAVTWSDEIVLGGDSRNGYDPTDFVVARFSSTGALLSTDRYDFQNGSGDLLIRIKIQPDGKILAVGATIAANQSFDFALARFTAWGSVDTSFGFGGGLRIDAFGYTDHGWTVAFQGDGKILVGGYAYYPNNNGYYMSLYRLNASGTAFDPTFGGGTGQVYVGFGPSQVEEIRDIVVQSDGKIVAVGNFNGNNNYDVALLRFMPGGALDNTFLGGGAFLFGASPDSFDGVTGLALQPDGKIIVGGASTPGLRLSRHLK